MTRKSVAVFRDLDRILGRAPETVDNLLGDVRELVLQSIGFDIGCIALMINSDPMLMAADEEYGRALLGNGRMGPKVTPLRSGVTEIRAPDPSFIRHVAATKSSQLAGDTRSEPHYFATRDDIRSELAVPILLDDVVLGVINLESVKLHYYTPNDRRCAERIARRIARPLRELMVREGLISAVEPSMEQLRQILDKVPPGVRLEASKDLAEVASVIAKALHSRRCAIFFKGSALHLVCAVAVGGPGPWASGEVRLLASRAFHSRCTSRDAGSGGHSPLIAAPLLAAADPIGAVVVGGRRRTPENPRGYFTSADGSLFEILQTQLAAYVALRRREISRSEIAMEGAKQISALLDLQRESDLNSTLKAAVAKVRDLLGARFCSIFLLDQERDVFVLRATRGLRQSEIGKAVYERGQGLTGWVAHYGKPLRIVDRSQDYLKSIAPDLQWKEVHPEGRGRQGPFLAVPIFIQNQSVGVIRVSYTKSGRAFNELDERILTIIASNIAGAIAQSRRYSDRVELLQKLQEPTHFLATKIQDLGGSLLGLETAMREAVDRAAAALGAQVVTLFQTNTDGSSFEGRAVAGGSPNRADLIQLPSRPDNPAHIVLRKGTLYWDSIPTKWKLRRHIPQGRPTCDRFAVREECISAAGVRLEIGDQRLGVLFINYREPQHFDVERRYIIEAFATQIALFLQIARITRRTYQFGATEQAEHLAREVHDDIIPILAWKVQGAIDAVKSRLAKNDVPGAERRLEAAEAAVRYCSQECRAIMSLMRTPIIEQKGLVGALRLFRGDLREYTVVLDLPSSDGAIPLATKNHLYRIAQTAVANIVMWARARRITIRLAIGKNVVSLEVADNGTGFDVVSAKNQLGHFGLKGIEERARVLGGEVEIKSEMGIGSTIRVAIPFEGGAYVG